MLRCGLQYISKYNGELASPFESQRVHIESAGQEVSRQRRRERYMAIGKYARAGILTWYYLRTMLTIRLKQSLMQLLREDLVRGLSGIDSSNSSYPLGNPDVRARGISDCSAKVERRSRPLSVFHIHYIEDESNQRRVCS